MRGARFLARLLDAGKLREENKQRKMTRQEEVLVRFLLGSFPSSAAETRSGIDLDEWLHGSMLFAMCWRKHLPTNRQQVQEHVSMWRVWWRYRLYSNLLQVPSSQKYSAVLGAFYFQSQNKTKKTNRERINNGIRQSKVSRPHSGQIWIAMNGAFQLGIVEATGKC